MKKILLFVTILVLSGCAGGNNLPKEIGIEKPTEAPITKQGDYALDCYSKYYTDITVGGKIMDGTYAKVSQASERDTLYVHGDTAKYFGADYQVIQDNESYLIMMRHYDLSGLTEVVSINKETGIGFDTKTLTFSITGAPVTDTYLISCREV